jgi:hypothetical protein
MRNVLIFSFSLMFLFSTSIEGETLQELLTRETIDGPSCRTADLSKTTTSGGSVETDEERIIATYTMADAISLPDYLYVFRYDKRLKQWLMAELRWPQFDDASSPDHACSGGSITAIMVAPHFIYLEGHRNPSASCTMVITKDLAFHDTFYGGPVGQFTDGSVIFQNSQVHFAPTHYTELSIYDPKSKSRTWFHPASPYKALRNSYIEEVKRLYEPCCERPQGATCSEPDRFGNHHCNPDLFDNYLRDIAINAETNAIIFINVFDDIVPEQWDVVYIYRNLNNGKQLEYQELLLNDLHNTYGFRPLKEYLHQDVLDEIFR